ncbi:MAG TPA: aldehyde dehydrogenase (NADP(+)) [Gammaproteobacteria bacterium]|nr:aldehyde dehydrogenase (NADP(+)) [Gammaproteobacteria bacterium]
MTGMTLHGQQLIGNETSARGAASIHARDPAGGTTLEPAFHEATSVEIDQAMEKAAGAFDAFRQRSPAERAGLLTAIAEEIEALGDDLLERAGAETGLPSQRLTGERTRTVNQARLFAGMIGEGTWCDARIDRGNPERTPAPKPDVRRMMMPIGPVVVFGASNFPLAISVAGTDTISALGAGCPVVVKAHPGHPGTSEMVARAILRAAERCGMPDGVFSLVHGASNAVGAGLVQHRRTCAVGFTGSLKGGRALYDLAVSRADPIPVYAEMGSTNPVFVLPGALAERGESIAESYVQSVTLGTGQFCTNPGVLLGLRGDALSGFTQSVARLAEGTSPTTMLHAGIRSAFEAGLQRIERVQGVTPVGRSGTEADPDRTEAGVRVYSTDADTFRANPGLAEEVFGPSSIIVDCESPEDMQAMAEDLEGHLTATVHGTEADLQTYAPLLRTLERKVGRLIFNGFPTGIEVCAAMQHGGPYPATTDSHFTSIGTAAIYRFVRPVAYQGFPQGALPAQLKDRNEMGIWRLVDNEWTRDDC